MECHVPHPAPSGLPPLRRHPQGTQHWESEDDIDHHPAPELLDPRSAWPRPPEQAQPQSQDIRPPLEPGVALAPELLQPGPVGMGQRRARSRCVLAFQFRD